MGGLDIFKAKPQPDGSWIVQNMKSPINSFADDFGITFENGNERGYIQFNTEKEEEMMNYIHLNCLH